jgi:hypothetical protein
MLTLCLLLLSFQVRKERLGDRITALHQIVSPFGKVQTLIPLTSFLDPCMLELSLNRSLHGLQTTEL